MNTKLWLPGWFGLFLLAVFLFTQAAGAQGLSFPKLQTNQKQKIGWEAAGIEISGWNNISGYNDNEFLPFINKHQNYSGSYFQGQAREIFLRLTGDSQKPYATLVRELGKASWKRRADALAALGHMGAVEAIPLIIPSLQDTRRPVRLNALWALVKIDPKNPLVARAAIEFFSAKLEDHPRMAFWALAATGNRSEEVIDLVVLKTIKNANLILQDSLVFLRKSDYIPTHLLRENLTHFDLQNRY
ncbi:MAG: HEAT repeat domain-containing protein, partial [Sphingomonadales bacterium]